MNSEKEFSNRVIDVAIRIAAIAVLVIWCFEILRPFVMLVVWGAIIAIALYPIVGYLHSKTGLSKGKSSGLLSFIGVLLLLIPLIALSSGLFTSASDVFTGVQEGTITIPPPKEDWKEIPLVGDKVYAAMAHASNNLEGAMVKYAEEIRSIASKLAGFIGSIGGGFVQFIISTIIAGLFMSNAQACQEGLTKLVARITGGSGDELVELSKTTVRSVVQGVIGVATIQAVMSAIALVIVGVPAASLWALAVLLTAIIQLPPIIALLPAILYVFNVESTLVASLFLVWCIIVSGSDAVLKPILLSRGSDIPMLVILLGALGGMAMSGIVGLFVGAVILGLTYKLLVVWVNNGIKV